jgi:predicted nucleic acid-binding protein
MIGLGKGENEAIILAIDNEATLIVDENSARKLAKRQGMHVIGSLGLVRVAFRICVIERGDFESRVFQFRQRKRAKPENVSWALQATKIS